jgi:hypothetical protein
VALNHPGWEAVLDDHSARREATRLGIPCIGTVGLGLVTGSESSRPSPTLCKPSEKRLCTSRMGFSASPWIKPGSEAPRWGLETMRRHGAKNADYRGGVTPLYDTQLLGACLHASECGGRSRPGAVRGMPDVPIAPPATGPPEGWAAVGFVSPASFNRGLWARLLGVLGS